MKTLQFFESCVIDDNNCVIINSLSDCISPRLISKLAFHLENEKKIEEYMINPVDGDIYDIIDSMLVKIKGIWKPVPKSIRVELYQLIHFA